MNYKADYFFLKDAGDSPRVYLQGKEDNLVFRLTEEIPQPEFPYNVYMEKPILPNHKLADVYIMDSRYHVISEKVKNAIEELSPAKTDFIPAVLHRRNKDYEGYFILNNYNLHEVVDLDKSEYLESASGGLLSIDKLVLDSAKLNKIPENERLIITVAESKIYKLFHKSVIDNIEKTKPRGCFAVSLESWDSDLMFEM